MLRLLFGFVLGAIVVIFAIQNTGTVDYAFLVWRITAPRAIVVLAVFVVGLFSGVLARGFRPRRRR